MELHVHRDDLGPLAAEIRRLTAAGRGWINVASAEGDLDLLVSTQSVPGMIFGRVGGRGPANPKITWTAPQTRRRTVEPAALGIEHPAGSKARDQLASAGLPVPPGWPVLQDHALRGLVVVPPDDSDPADVMAWAIDAATILAGTDLGADWVARVFEGV
ncbi:MAG: hypothetical protein ACXIVQ_12645 [Acidimicrobiales bacterium]